MNPRLKGILSDISELEDVDQDSELTKLMKKKEDLLDVFVVTDTKSGLQIASSKFVHTVHTPQLNALYNAQYREREKFANKALKKGEFEQFVNFHEKPFRLDAFLEIKSKIKGERYWKLLQEIWIMSENIWQDQSDWYTLLSAKNSNPEAFMTEEDLEFWQTLKGPLNIYRGCNPLNEDGFSYTLDEEKAYWFANRYKQEGAKVIHKVVEKEDCFAYLGGRGEQEIIYFKDWEGEYV